MALTRLAIERPLLTALMCLVLVSAGLLTGSRLPVDLNPQADLATVTVTWIYPGASPTAVEQQIAKPLETTLRGLPRLRHLSTICQDSACFAYLEYEVGTPIGEALADCREALAAARSSFPAGLADPVLAELDINAQPVLLLGLTGDVDLARLRRVAVDTLEPRIRAVPGVTAVEVLGGQTRQVAIEVDRQKLLDSGLTLNEVGQAVVAANVNAPSGVLESGQRQQGVRLVGQLATLDDLRSVPLPPPQDPGAMIAQALRPGPAHAPQRALLLGDVATVREVAVDEPVHVRLQGQPAVGLIVTKRGDGNTVRLAREVLAVAKAAPLPPDVKVGLARNQAKVVHEALSDVIVSLILGVLLCAAAVALFLRDRRATLIVCVTIPVCLVGALAPMAWGGHTLNQMTLLGLALSIGILVDDSIVCIEAIIARLQAGEPAAQAALNGRNDIALADTSTTLLDLAVFGPIAFMAGAVGQFFRDFGFVVSVIAALSLLVAYTVVPSLAALLFARRAAGPEALAPSPAMTRLSESYAAAIEWALDHRWATLGLGWLGLALAGLLAWSCLAVDLIPAADLGAVAVNLELPGAASLAATTAAVQQAEQLIAAVPDVESQFTTIGRIEIGFGVVSRVGPRYAQLNLALRDKPGPLDWLLARAGRLRRRSDDAVAAEIRSRLAQLPGVTSQVIAIHGWGGAGAPVDFSLYGQSTAELGQVGPQVLDGLRQLSTLLNADMAWQLGEPEVRVQLDADRARELYVYSGAVARELRIALTGQEVGTLNRGEAVGLPIWLRLRQADRQNAGDLLGLPVGRGQTRPITLADVSTTTAEAGPTRIDRRDGQHDMNFKAYLAPGVSLGLAQAEISALLDRLGIAADGSRSAADSAHPSLRWGWRGDAQTMADSAKYMAGTALLGLVLSYLIMAVLFNSAVHPFTILLSVPMAGTGALLLLAAAGSSLSIVSGIGFILLIGIVVRNAILLVDLAQHLRAQGRPRRQAIVESGRRRLRPILMTTFTTVIGMVPVALGIGRGAEVRAPMAIAVIGGLLVSTALTLIIIPVTYELLDDWFGGRGGQSPAATDNA